MTNKTITLSRELAQETATLIIRDICEYEPDDNPDSLCITVKALELILLQRLEDASNALADPVPPAGGEPDRYDHAEEDMEESAFGEYVTYECYEADVTRLQAEVERLKSDLDQTSERRHEEAKATLSAMEDANNQFAETLRLQSELTKARDTLREIVCACGDEKSHGYISMLADDGLPNQSAPADKAPPLIQTLNTNGDRIAMEATIAQQAQRIADLEAGNGQGDPVAWMNVATGEVTTCPVVVMDWDDENEKVQSLYAEQPAPVAVVMPGRLKSRPENPAARIAYIKGWNACLDEVTRLNPIKQ